MNRAQKKFGSIFALVSLGFVLLCVIILPCPAKAATTNTNAKREAAGSQFARAEDLRATLNAKAAGSRSLAEYKKVAASYQRVYLITPHAAEVPDALLAVGELNTEMGDRFGRSYYQTAVDSYEFLIREYPSSKLVPDAMLRIAKLQKDQLGEPAAATKSYQTFQKKFPRSEHKREVQEALAELALLKNMETGAAMPATPPSHPMAPATPKVETARMEPRAAAQGGEKVKSGAIPRVQRIRTNVAPDSTEIVIELEDMVQYASGRIANPERIYFDLHAARLSPVVERNNVRVSGDLLTRVRVAQNQSGVVRVVLDVNGVKDYSASLMKKPTRLLIELYGTASPAKADAVQAAKTIPNPKPILKGSLEEGPVAAPPLMTEPVADSATEPGDLGKKLASPPPIVAASPMPPPAAPKPDATTASLKNARAKTSKTGTATKPDLVQPSSTPQPTRDGQSTLTRALGLKIGRIVIDAGHGGHDTGTIGPTGLMEKDLCLDVALRFGKIIQQKLPGAEIVFTRSDDTFIPLEERTRIANEAKADLFVSIHANSSPDRAARGVETYYLNLKASPGAMDVAARENAVSQQNIHQLEDLVKKIAQTEKIDESRELAEDVQDSLSKRIQRTARPVKNRGVRKAPFVVLIGADMPSILIEISFLSNPADEQLLKKPEHRQRVAEGLYQGIADYLQSMNSMAVNRSGRPNRAAVIPTVEQTRNQK